MIEKYNITINHKETKEIEYKLWLDEDFWCKYEYDTEYKIIYIENIILLCYKSFRGRLAVIDHPMYFLELGKRKGRYSSFLQSILHALINLKKLI